MKAMIWQVLKQVVRQFGRACFPSDCLDAFALRNQEIRTDRTFELGVSPLVRGASLLMLLSSVACGAITIECDSRCVV